MAYLATHHQDVLHLSSLHTIGRLPHSVDTCIPRPEISRYHATIKWQAPHWSLRDISLNGTWINQKRLIKNKDYQLNIGDQIHFGSLSSPPFTFKDDTSPVDLLILKGESSSQNSEIIHLEHYHLLPKEDAPTLAIFKRDHIWQVEELTSNKKAARPLQNKEWLQIGDHRWQLRLAHEDMPTLKMEHDLALCDIRLTFYVSLDEESTKLLISTPENIYDLQVRVHHYLALQLARHKLQDIGEGYDRSEQGWVYTETLAKELGMDITHLNIQIHRARKQVCETVGLNNSSFDFIQRRAGKVRIGCPHITIFKGEKLELTTDNATV